MDETESEETRELMLLQTTLRVSEGGSVERKKASGKWMPVKNTANHKQGYNVIMVNKKQYMRSRIVCHVFLGLELAGPQVILHKDGNKLNCSVSNLSIETHSSISYYRTGINGWHYDKNSKKYIGLITHNGVTKRLGTFLTPDEAHTAYMKEKNIILGLDPIE